MDINKFEKLPLIGILRGIDEETIEPLTQTIISSGLNTVEITMNTPLASQLIKAMVKQACGRLTIGAGTVLSQDDLKQATDAGASFIVSPTLIPKVVEECVKDKIPVFPGALTPQEIYQAWNMGATMVKVFPAKFFGPTYFKDIKGPFAGIKLLACGGVTLNNLDEFFNNGASAIAFGGSIFKKELLRRGDFSAISKGIKELIDCFKKDKCN